jgi:hypothetical protein
MNSTDNTQATQLAVLAPTNPKASVTKTETGSGGPSFELFGEDGFTFLDLIDIANPLQHIPVISTLYRQFTGDLIDPASRVIGGTVFGGPIGAAASFVNVLVNQSTGRDIGEHVYAFLSGEDSDDDGANTAIAEGGDVNNISAFETASGQSGQKETPENNTPRNGTPTRWADAGLMPTQVFVETLSPSAQRAVPDRAKVSKAAIQTSSLPHHTLRQNIDAYATAQYRNIDPADYGERRKEQERLAQARLNASDTIIKKAPHGAIARNGGWFSDVMLTALQSYEHSAKLTNKPSSTMSVVN